MNTVVLTDGSAMSALYHSIDKDMSGQQAKAAKLFARQFFASTSTSDRNQIADAERYGQFLEAWKFIASRPSHKPKIRFVQHRYTDNGKVRHGTCIYVLMNDMSFVVDSVRQGLNRAGVTITEVNNAVIYASRKSATSKSRGQSRTAAPVVGVLQNLVSGKQANYQAEAVCCIHCLLLDEAQCQQLRDDIDEILQHVIAANADYPAMCKRALDISAAITEHAGTIPVSGKELSESLEFINWLVDNHFTFLGYEEYRITAAAGEVCVDLQKASMLGVAKFKTSLKARVKFSSLSPGVGELILKKKICSFAKSSIRSRVHRPVYQDYVLLKEFDDNGNIIKEHRFIGLYTSAVYYRTALEIPLVRAKVARVLDHSGFAPNGHSIKDLLQVINVFPRDELFQVSHKQLANTAIEIARFQETRTSKLFIRRDAYGKFFSCLVFVPRDVFNTSVRIRIQECLRARLRGEEIDFNTFMSDSLLVRIHYTVRVPKIHLVKYSTSKIEQELVALIKPWEDTLREALQAQHNEQTAARYFKLYAGCFSSSYKESYSADTAAADILFIENVIAGSELTLRLAACQSDNRAELSFKIFSHKQQLFLSDVDPILENLGLNIISEKAFKLQTATDETVWLHEFSLYRQFATADLNASLFAKFEDAFHAIWRQRTNNDSFNSLVLAAGVSWRDAALLRAFAAYLKQIQFAYGIRFIAQTLVQHKQIAKMLTDYFYALFEPAQRKRNDTLANNIRHKLTAAIDAVVNLSEDSVLRGFLNVIDGTVRSNYFQESADGQLRDYFSFKLSPERIDGVPLPRPKFEIFVFSNRMEGVHLRGGKVARGGLRWSDRTQDYRTEVLGLVKAQQVKNAVIVPVGAKGGFVVKQSQEGLSRDEFMALGVSCYRTFVSGLLDITDNMQGVNVVPPKQVVRRDDDDPYLVVAADKGTATFSDIANKIAAEYGFWLGDGFASGGSNGYDHKQMGITAKGAWVSVQRHFRELGVNVQEQDFSVVGIGDMAGDVFGNGMLRSAHICLVAAFNHMHIFVDPDPDAATTFAERQRLFQLPRSSWADFNPKLISEGGGIFERSAKSITISAQMQRRFGIAGNSLSPNELIRYLLRSEVDLLWNGGIGTYVKAATESHADVGDKTNDGLRINANELRCKVVGEGGNLGMTQSGRVEYGKRGGISLTDFIDNSAGVDCSDHEVNIKIVLNKLLATNALTLSSRNRLLKAMTDEVSALVLDNNYNQVQAIGITVSQMALRSKEYAELISYLEAHAGLNRGLENLPDRDQLEERHAKQQFLTRPEIAVVTSYMKMYLKTQLVDAPYLQDSFLHRFLYSAFPKRLATTYRDQILQHPLRREIIATQLANAVVNLAGPSFVYRMADSTGSSVIQVVKAAVLVTEIFKINNYWSQIEALDFKIAANVQTELMSRLIRLIRRSTRWMLRHRHSDLDFAAEIDFFAASTEKIRRMLPQKLPPDFATMFADKLAYLDQAQVPAKLSERITQCEFLFPAISFIEISNSSRVKLGTVVEIYYAIGEELQLNWLGKMVNQLAANSYWQALARESFLDELSRQQQALTCNVVGNSHPTGNARHVVTHWADKHSSAIARTRALLKQLQTETQPDYAMFSVILREFQTLSASTEEA